MSSGGGTNLKLVLLVWTSQVAMMLVWTSRVVMMLVWISLVTVLQQSAIAGLWLVTLRLYLGRWRAITGKIEL